MCYATLYGVLEAYLGRFWADYKLQKLWVFSDFWIWLKIVFANYRGVLEVGLRAGMVLDFRRAGLLVSGLQP